VEGEVITFAAPTIPAWLTLTQNANGSATLTGTSPVDATGEIPVVIQVRDTSTTSVTKQEFLIVVNARPVITEILISTNEDTSHEFETEFAENFTDSDGNTLTEIQIKQLPAKGRLVLGGNAVALDAKIPASEVANLVYVPYTDSTGTDIIKWNGSDGIYYSLTDENIKVMIFPINDPPEIIAIEPVDTDTLKYEMGSEIPIQLTKLFDARDADGDNLIAAEISFVDPLEVIEKQDQFVFKDTLGIVGSYNETFGILTLTGKAPVEDYVAAIRSVKYNYLNGLKTDLLTRRVSIKLSDNVFGQTKDRLVGLIYTKVELDIANAFTPNGDEANAYWRIYSPNGLEKYKDALIRVYNKRGTLVYEATGFTTPWNGVGSEGALPPDSYYYTIDLKYDKKKFKGVVTILR
jgi:gliding motility-associated-like protein